MSQRTSVDAEASPPASDCAGSHDIDVSPLHGDARTLSMDPCAVHVVSSGGPSRDPTCPHRSEPGPRHLGGLARIPTGVDRVTRSRGALETWKRIASEPGATHCQCVACRCLQTLLSTHAAVWCMHWCCRRFSMPSAATQGARLGLQVGVHDGQMDAITREDAPACVSRRGRRSPCRPDGEPR
jgi:hypothetical protein